MRIPFLIGGGGIGGLATALALSRTGCAVHLIEKDDEFDEIGAGLQLPPKASRMLHPCVLDEIAKSRSTRSVWSGEMRSVGSCSQP